MPAGWKIECVGWRNWVQLLHKGEAACGFPEAGRWRECTVETLSGWARGRKGRVFYEANKCLQQLPGSTSERGCADWNVNSWLCTEFQGRIPPGPSCKSGTSDWPDGGARGRSRPTAACRKRQRSSREESKRPRWSWKRREDGWKLANAKTFLTLSLFIVWPPFSTFWSVWAWWRTELVWNCCKISINGPLS